MTLVRYQPRSLLSQFYNDVNQLLEPDYDSVSEWAPAIDIKETERNYVLHADVPGVQAEDIDITLEDAVLSIKGSRTQEKTEEKQNYKRVERARGTFYRRFALPDTADADSVSAKVVNGVLEVVVPKQEKVLPRKVKVLS